jgi:hypothetical protein
MWQIATATYKARKWLLCSINQTLTYPIDSKPFHHIIPVDYDDYDDFVGCNWSLYPGADPNPAPFPQ